MLFAHNCYFVLLESKRNSITPLLRLLNVPSESFDMGDEKAQKKSSFPYSPCPSPTPIFQQLYLALAKYERMFSDSPDPTMLAKNEKAEIVEESETLQVRSRCNSLSSTNNEMDSIKINNGRRGSSPAHLSIEKIGKNLKPVVKIRINNC